MALENPEILEATVAEIADACREVLDEEICDEIAEQDNPDDALGLAFTALCEAGEDPEEYLKEKGVLE